MSNCKIEFNSLKFRCITLLCAFMMMYSHLNAQEKNLIPYKRCLVKTLNFEQGLMNNGTYSIVTDVNGFTWVSTRTGMQRYNGYTLEKISPVVNKDTINITSPVYFFSLLNGTIWISYQYGILEYSPATNSFRYIIQLKPSLNFFYPIAPLKETAEGIWCMQEGKGIVICNRQGVINKIVSYNTISFCDSVFNSGTLLFRHANASNDNFIFIHHFTNQVLKINVQTHQVQIFSINTGLFSNIACSDHYLYNLSDTGLYAVNFYTGEIVKNISLKTIINEPVNYTSIATTGENQLLLGVNGHLIEMDSSFIHQNEFTTLDRKSIVSTGGIVFIYPDKFRRLWLLTNDDIKRIKNVEVPFQHFLYPNGKNNFVRSLYYDEQKHLLLAGCLNGGIQLYDTLSNPLWKEPLITKDVKDILAIEKLTQDEYIIITIGRGWYILSLSTKKIRPFDFPPQIENLIQPRLVRFPNNIQRINDSTILICTYRNIFRCVFSKAKIKSAEPLLSFTTVFQNLVSCFLYDNNKTLWAGTSAGILYKLDKNQHAEIFPIPSNYMVRTITEDSIHHIWVGTDKGLYSYTQRGELTNKITTESGLLNDCIYGLLPINHDSSVFASSNLGLSYISSDGIIKNYSKELGLQENEFNTNACLKTASGKFYFGGVNGITAFYPSALSTIKDTPVLNITRLVVNDHLYNIYSDSRNGDSILLRYNQNHLQFDFAALGLLNANEYNYKYRVKGFEESWHSTYNPTDIRYTLSPGKYTFEISCSPLLSSNSVFYKRFIIIIYPPWWKTWWFISLAFIVLISSIAFIIFQYNHRRYLQKIRQLQLRNEIQNERERISRELHDNIGTQLSYISSNVDWLLEAPISFSKEEETKRLSVVNDTAKNLVSDLRETIWAMKKESIQLDELADKLKSFLQSQCVLQPQMEMDVNENIEKNIRLSPLEALNIFRICQEAIVNCIKHSQAEKISLSIQSGVNEGFAFIIEDNGKSFQPDREYNGHYGLENMKSRAVELGAKLFIDSSAEKGTKISLVKNLS